MVQSGWTLCVSRSTPDREKPSGISHKWRCIKAIASAKAGEDFSYQAALLSKMRKVQLGTRIGHWMHIPAMCYSGYTRSILHQGFTTATDTICPVSVWCPALRRITRDVIAG